MQEQYIPIAPQVASLQFEVLSLRDGDFQGENREFSP